MDRREEQQAAKAAEIPCFAASRNASLTLYVANAG
jgi:hypothetical protein